MRYFIGSAIALGLIIPSVSFAAATGTSVTITSATLNGGTYGNGAGYLVVNPGDPITVTLTADLTNKAKWKGTGWGINTTGATPTCSNTKNKHGRQIDTGRGSSWYGGDGSDDDKNGKSYQDEHSDHQFDGDRETNNTYIVTFSIFAPNQNGVYNAYFLPDGKNNCGSPAGALFALTQAIVVGINPVPPVIAPHSDMLVTLANLTDLGTTVTYTNPDATSNVDGTDPVSCLPASGSFFPLGSTIVTCMAHDSLGNMAMPVSFTVTVVPPPDTTPPTIAPHADVVVFLANSTDTSGVVPYTLPIATDNVGIASLSCTPASGSTFNLGSTTVYCNAQDAAGNTASTTSFVVGVYAPAAPVALVPFVMTAVSQLDDSTLCPNTFDGCFAGGDVQTYNLGTTSDALKSVTVELDPGFRRLYNPWQISIQCFTDAAYTQPCTDWVAPTIQNGQSTSLIRELATGFVANGGPAQGDLYTADFTNPSNEQNFGSGTTPVYFNPAYYYQLVLNDEGSPMPPYGSSALNKPYYLVTGLH